MSWPHLSSSTLLLCDVVTICSTHITTHVYGVCVLCRVVVFVVVLLCQVWQARHIYTVLCRDIPCRYTDVALVVKGNITDEL